MPACPPVDCFLWVLQQHRTGYKSHYIITAPRFASRSARPLHVCDWPVRLLGRPLRQGHRCNRKSRLLSWDRWLGKGLSLNCQSCSFLCASHSVQLPATRWVRSDETRCIPTETYGSRLIKAEVATCDWSGHTDSVLLSNKNISMSSYWTVSIWPFPPTQFLKYFLFVSRHWAQLSVFSSLIFFWLRDSSTPRRQTTVSVSLSPRHQNGKVKWTRFMFSSRHM